MGNAHWGDSWESLQQEIFTTEEIVACNRKAAAINELIRTRKEKACLTGSPSNPDNVNKHRLEE